MLSPGLAQALLLGLLVVLTLAACSTARQRDEPVGVGSLLNFRDAATADFFQDSYRTGSLYVDFRPALLVDAIVMDRPYRRRYVEMLTQRLLLPPAEATRLQAEQDREFESRFSVLLFVYEGTHRPVQLSRKDAAWKVLLRDDDGTLLSPVAVTRVAEDNPAYLYLDQYFTGLDRWSRMYRVDFPKLSKELLGQALGTQPFELLVTGVKGTVRLRWVDPAPFYAPATGQMKRGACGPVLGASWLLPVLPPCVRNFG